MRIHILGICGTFMGGLAMLARQLGHEVTGSDANVYPPMSTLLEKQGIELIQGYDASQLDPQPDLVIIGNAMTRGNPCVEAVLEKNIPYMSGPQWLHDFVLRDRWVLAVAGTHGKTTTAGMATWILEQCGYKPGFVIGGVPGNFEVSARLGESDFFVETHYLLGVQNIDNKNCKVYLLSDCGHYKDSVLQSGSLVVKMIDFEKQKGQWVGDYLWEPRGGAMYEGSIRETIIFSDEETEIKKTITDETEEKVKAYYDTDEVA